MSETKKPYDPMVESLLFILSMKLLSRELQWPGPAMQEGERNNVSPLTSICAEVSRKTAVIGREKGLGLRCESSRLCTRTSSTRAGALHYFCALYRGPRVSAVDLG